MPPLCDRILVVDDNEAMLESLREVLEVAGATVATASTTDEAERVLASGFRPSIIVVDVKLGGGETSEGFIARLRDDPFFARIPIVAMSGAASELRRVDADVDRTLVKPFDVEHFFEVLNDLCKPSTPSTLFV